MVNQRQNPGAGGIESRLGGMLGGLKSAIPPGENHASPGLSPRNSGTGGIGGIKRSPPTCMRACVYVRAHEERFARIRVRFQNIPPIPPIPPAALLPQVRAPRRRGDCRFQSPQNPRQSPRKPPGLASPPTAAVACLSSDCSSSHCKRHRARASPLQPSRMSSRTAGAAGAAPGFGIAANRSIAHQFD